MSTVPFSRAELEAYEKIVRAFPADDEDFPPAGSLEERIGNADPEQELEELLSREKERRGIDWRAFYDNARGEMPRVDALLKALGASFTAQQLLRAENVIDLPNFTITNSPEGRFIDYVTGLRGNDIKTYITKLCSKMQIADNQFGLDDVLGGVTTLYASGVVAVGFTWTMDFMKGIFIGFGPGRSARAAARGLGSRFCRRMVGLLVVYGIKSLVDKKAQMLAVVVNRTGNEMNFEDPFADNGKFLTLPRVDAGESGVDDRSSINRAYRYEEEDTEIAPAGWVNASKRNLALVGVKAAVKIAFTGNNPNPFQQGAYMGFSVPYSGRNKCGCSLHAFSSSEAYLSGEEAAFSIGQEKLAADGGRVQAYMNSESGGVVNMIVVCQAPFASD